MGDARRDAGVGTLAGPATVNTAEGGSLRGEGLLHSVATTTKRRGRVMGTVGKAAGMRVVIGAPSNGAVMKDAIKEFLQGDERVTEVRDLSEPDISYPQVSFRAAQAVVDGEADRAVLVCGTGVGTAIAASKVRGARAATAHDLVTVRGAVENYDAQILCLGQNVIATAHARDLVDLWLGLRHDASGFYGPKVREIAEYESRA